MKLLPDGLLLSGAVCALATASLVLPACGETAHVGGSSTPGYGNTRYQRVRGNYCRCHPDNVCHSAHYPNYYWSGKYHRPIALPARPRPR